MVSKITYMYKYPREYLLPTLENIDNISKLKVSLLCIIIIYSIHISKAGIILRISSLHNKLLLTE